MKYVQSYNKLVHMIVICVYNYCIFGFNKLWKSPAFLLGDNEFVRDAPDSTIFFYITWSMIILLLKCLQIIGVTKVAITVTARLYHTNVNNCIRKSVCTVSYIVYNYASICFWKDFANISWYVWHTIKLSKYHHRDDLDKHNY